MALFRRNKVKKELVAETMPLALPPAYGNTPVKFSGRVVHSFRHMITRLVRNEPLPQRISFVSALREEGVTYTALAMATTIASDLDKTVCVVELNWWWPGIVEHIPDIISPGLAAVFQRKKTLDDVIVPTGLPNLFLLPAGDLPKEHRPLAARSEYLNEILKELAPRYDHILLDVPAILATSDAIPLASLGDKCCVVIRQGVTSVENVRLALDDIEHMPMLGALMNKVQIHTPSLLLRFIPQE